MLPNGLLYTRNSKYRADWGSGVWRGGWGSYSPAINELSREQMKATRQLWQMWSQQPCQVRMGARAGVGGKRRVPFALGRGSFHWEGDFWGEFCLVSRSYSGLRDRVQKGERLCSTDTARESAPELEGLMSKKERRGVPRESWVRGPESTWIVLRSEGDTNSRYKLLLMLVKAGKVAVIMPISNKRKLGFKEAEWFTRNHVAPEIITGRVRTQI